MIPEYYKDREVFITGGSGILGKGIIEKLLRSTEVSKIYMLLREKKRVSTDERLSSFKTGIVFRRLRKEKPNALDKLVAIPGDINLPLLGLTEESFKTMENVSMIIHSAATVRFDEPLRNAIRMNVLAPYEALKVGKKLAKLELFIHISTFYSNPSIKPIENKIYPPPMEWKMALKLMDSDLSDETLDILTKPFIGSFPNTYTFTKNLGENLVNDHSHLFPILIVKPSVIIFSLLEPEPSYVETYYGITGMSAFYGTGMLRTIFAKKNVHFDLVFLDLVVNLTLIKAAHMAWKQSLTRIENPQILLICSEDIHTFAKCTNNTRKTMNKYPFDKSIWYHGKIVVTACYSYYLLRVIIYQIIPSFILDRIFMKMGVKPMMMAFQRKAFLGNKEIVFFTFNTFPNTGITDQQELKEFAEDTSFSISQQLFCLEKEEGKKEAYNKFVLGSRRFLMKEHDATLPYARIKMRLLKMIDWVSKGIVYFVAARIFYYLFMKYVNQRIEAIK